MSLNWDLTKVENYKTKCFVEDNGQPKLNPLTKILIFYTMAVEIGEITEKNAEEFLTRIKMHDAVGGNLGYGDDGDYSITLDDVMQHVGLKTNVFPQLSKAGFAAKLGKMLREQAANAVRKEKEILKVFVDL